MASTRDYLDYVLSFLEECENISFKLMMGEYLLYKNGILFGGIYDNRLLIKITKTNISYGLKEEIPYPGGKPMYLIDIENKIEIRTLVETTILGLKK